MNSHQMGKTGESNFVRVMQERGHAITKSTDRQDMFEHWDYLINGKWKVEVKARKKAKRSDNKVNDDIVFVEFKNVRGNSGWLYGRADVFAFERPNGFLLIHAKTLRNIADRLLDNATYSKGRPQLYHLYRRRDRPKECVGVLSIGDLLAQPHKMVTYTDGTEETTKT